MQYTNSKPSRGETRYWSFIGESREGKVILLLKVEVQDVRWDYENEYDTYECKVLEIIVDSLGDYTSGSSVIVDFPWQMQKTLNQAQTLMLYGVLEKGTEVFFSSAPPF